MKSSHAIVTGQRTQALPTTVYAKLPRQLASVAFMERLASSPSPTVHALSILLTAAVQLTAHAGPGARVNILACALLNRREVTGPLPPMPVVPLVALEPPVPLPGAKLSCSWNWPADWPVSGNEPLKALVPPAVDEQNFAAALLVHCAMESDAGTLNWLSPEVELHTTLFDGDPVPLGTAGPVPVLAAARPEVLVAAMKELVTPVLRGLSIAEAAARTAATEKSVVACILTDSDVCGARQRYEETICW